MKIANSDVAVTIKIRRTADTDEDSARDVKNIQVTKQKLIFNYQMCTVLHLRDITHVRKMVQLEYQNMKIQLRESSVTHELIAPLRCIINLSDTLIDKSADDEKN
jgi:hypothetical protein